MILTETPRRILVTKLVNWGHWFTLLNIVIAVVIASVYVFTSPLPGTLLGTLFLFSNWLSHIGFLTFFGFVIFILPLCYIIANAKVVKAISSAIAAIGLALLAFDALLYNKYGLHLSVNSAELIRTEAQTAIAEFGWQQWGFLLLLFVVWLSFQLVIANALWQRIGRLQKFKLALPISSFFVLCFVLSHGVHVWADANLYQPIVQQDDMFPLSYPATAKTLMSKYGLLDLERYQQRKELQFEHNISDIKYPIAPVYCGIDNSKKVIILVQLEGEPPKQLLQGMQTKTAHYDIASTQQSAVWTILFGLPELYKPALRTRAPVLLDLPSKLGVNVGVYSDQVLNFSGVANFTQDWQNFNQLVNSDTAKLAIGFVSESQLNELLSDSLINNNHVIVTQLASNRDNLADTHLSSNLTMEQGISSMEDIAGTTLRLFGCQAQINNYSSGQNLLSPRRSWLVSTQGSKVILLNNALRIEVLSNGNAKVFERESGEESIAPLNTGLLSQGIKHLSRFNK